jgi:hypothetical protein
MEYPLIVAIERSSDLKCDWYLFDIEAPNSEKGRGDYKKRMKRVQEEKAQPELG